MNVDLYEYQRILHYFLRHRHEELFYDWLSVPFWSEVILNNNDESVNDSDTYNSSGDDIGIGTATLSLR